jgi:hypothetical protein
MVIDINAPQLRLELTMGDIENDNDGINERWVMYPHRCLTNLVASIVGIHQGKKCDVEPADGDNNE